MLLKKPNTIKLQEKPFRFTSSEENLLISHIIWIFFLIMMTFQMIVKVLKYEYAYCLMKSTWTVLFYKDTNHTRDGVLWKLHALSFLETFFSSPELKDNELSLWLIFECFSEFNCHVFILSRTTVSISTKYWKSICERQFSVNEMN